jgi:hypothetical protein
MLQDFIMQNHFVKSGDHLRSKPKKKELTFLSEYFQVLSYNVSHCDLC